MADPSPDPHPSSPPNVRSGVRSGAPPRAPRWIKVSAIVVGVLILLIIVVRVTGLGGGDHGPGRHPGGGTPPAGVTVHTPPGGNPGGNPGNHSAPEGR
jgi:hypothetical protein